MVCVCAHESKAWVPYTNIVRRVELARLTQVVRHIHTRFSSCLLWCNSYVVRASEFTFALHGTHRTLYALSASRLFLSFFYLDLASALSVGFRFCLFSNRVCRRHRAFCPFVGAE
jgi:hypothetical protein